jgi:hypothetical protein
MNLDFRGPIRFQLFIQESKELVLGRTGRGHWSSPHDQGCHQCLGDDLVCIAYRSHRENLTLKFLV